MKQYDYIFTGSGLSALMTVYEMIISEKFKDKTILLIDENPKNENDRTWCFWDKENNYDHLVSSEWKAAWFKNENFEKRLNLNPYHYKKVKGLDLYAFIFDCISKENNITFIQQKVVAYEEKVNYCTVTTESDHYNCQFVLNSIYNPNDVIQQNLYPLLQQHFIGWFIKSKEAVFHKDCATFMDFSVAQKGNTRFMYVLPTSETEALIEYTLFSKDLLPKAEYELEIKNYIQKLGITEFEIIEKEKGTIPMTCYPFWKKNTKNIVNIGTAGGWTKASTGYTFKNTTKKAKKLTQFLAEKKDLRNFHNRSKFWFYDLLLLDILDQHNFLGSSIFSALFKEGKPSLILKFLDEETSIWEDIQVIWKCPKKHFIKALFFRIF